MTFRPPGTLRVLALLAKNSLLRLLRASQVRKARRQTVPGEGSRSGRSRRPTRRKRGDGLAWLLVLMLPLFAFQSLMMTGQAVVRLGVATEQYSELRSIAEAAVAEPAQGAPTDEDQPRYGGRYTGRRGDDFNVLTPARVWTQPGARERFVQCGALLLLTLLSMLVAIGFGGANANLAGGEWTQAWLMTFPVPTRSLTHSERTPVPPWPNWCRHTSPRSGSTRRSTHPPPAAPVIRRKTTREPPREHGTGATDREAGGTCDRRVAALAGGPGHRGHRSSPA